MPTTKNKKTTIKHLSPGTGQFKELMGMKGGMRVSIYFNPAKAHPESAGNVARFNALVADAKKQLISAGMKEDSADSFLSPLSMLNDDPEDWLLEQGSTAVFLDEENLYRIDNIGEKNTDMVVVANRFHIKPLLPVITDNRNFIALCMNLDDVQVYGGDSRKCDKIKIPDMPVRLQDVTWPDDPEKSLQQHTGSTTSAQGRPGTTGETAWHGQGASKDLDGDQKERMARSVCRALESYLKNLDESRPLVIVIGVDANIGLFRKYTTLDLETILEIDRDPSSMSRGDIHEIAREELKRFALEGRAEFISRLMAAKESEKSSLNIREVAVAAGLGRVDSCIVANDAEITGICQPEIEKVQIYENVEQECATDLLDYIAAETLLHGGKAYFASKDKIPGKSPVGAIFRY